MTQIDIQNTPFYEKINLTKLKYIVNHRDDYEDIILKEEKQMRRNDKYNAFTIFKKIIKITIPIYGSEFGYIPVHYIKGEKSNGIGRWYANKSIGLGPMISSVRHTICEGLWVDIDQSNSHPTIMKSFMDKFDFNSPILNENVSNRQNSLNKIAEEENCSPSEAKTHLISAINGKKFSSKTLKQLIDEIKPCINHVMDLPEYKDILSFCRK